MLQNVCLVTKRLFDKGSPDTREGHKQTNAGLVKTVFYKTE